MSKADEQSASVLPPRITRYTYRYHLMGSMYEALAMGLFQLNDVVARKALGASQLEITILATAGTGFFVFAFFFGTLMEGKPKGPFIFWAGLICRGALLLTAMTSHSMVFILLCCGVFLSEAVFIPAQISILKSNYDSNWRGRMFGRVVLMTRWMMPFVALGGGYLLDRNPELYRVLFPVAGVLGFVAFAVFARIKIRHRRTVPLRKGSTLKKFRRVLKENPDFDRFERNFFLYGVAFIMIIPVNVFLMVDHLQMSYSEFSIAKLLIPGLVMTALSPLAGRLFDRLKAIKAAGVAFSVLSLYPLTLFFSWYFQSIPLALVAMGLFGVAMSGVMQVWNLGSVYFSGEQDAAPFQGVHVTAVGVRGLCAPVIGLATSLVLSLGAAYLISTGLFLIGSLMMFWLARTQKAPPT